MKPSYGGLWRNPQETINFKGWREKRDPTRKTKKESRNIERRVFGEGEAVHNGQCFRCYI